MKIPGSIRNLYDSQKEAYELLKKRIDDRMKSLLDPKWHYESRIKEIESFTLKIETGRFNELHEIEDFFACTIVVENQNNISKAEQAVCEIFKLHERRPKEINKTHKRAESFPFDDLRLYLSWIDDPALRPSGIDGYKFELQIKTYLQHAWAIATHDLVYKSDHKSWPKERIAFQVKAMLEHAEVAISEADTLSQSNILNMSDKATTDLHQIQALIKDKWPIEQLPNDVIRLSQNTKNLIENLSISTERLKQILDDEEEEGRGAKTINLSPYAVILQSILNQDLQKVKNYLNKPKKMKLLIPREIDLPDFSQREKRNLILIQ